MAHYVAFKITASLAEHFFDLRQLLLYLELLTYHEHYTLVSGSEMTKIIDDVTIDGS